MPPTIPTWTGGWPSRSCSRRARARAERRGRLLREARAIARLSHPNVVTVHDAGTVDDQVYIAMEFVDGGTLDEWMAAETRTWREILNVFLDAGRGLAAAHAAGIIHRDFKPQNVMIGRDGSVRVTDFGLARLVSAVPETAPDEAKPASESGAGVPDRAVITRMTKTGALIGTPAYMAPEQFRRGQPMPAQTSSASAFRSTRRCSESGRLPASRARGTA